MTTVGNFNYNIEQKHPVDSNNKLSGSPVCVFVCLHVRFPPITEDVLLQAFEVKPANEIILFFFLKKKKKSLE